MPSVPYLIIGTVTDSNSVASSNAVINVTSSGGTKYGMVTNSNGQFTYDLADKGYSQGETVTIVTKSQYNNETSTDTFVVSGTSKVISISLTLRTIAYRAADYSPKPILHSVGRSPITKDNPLSVSVQNTTSQDIDLINNPAWSWTINRTDGQPDTETITLKNGDVYIRTLSYNGNNFLVGRSAWVKQ